MSRCDRAFEQEMFSLSLELLFKNSEDSVTSISLP